MSMGPLLKAVLCLYEWRRSLDCNVGSKSELSLVYDGLQRGCRLLSVLFTIFMDRIFMDRCTNFIKDKT